MKIYVVNKELSSAHGTTAVVLQFEGVMVYMRPVEMNLKVIIRIYHFSPFLVASTCFVKRVTYSRSQGFCFHVYRIIHVVCHYSQAPVILTFSCAKCTR